MKRTADEKSPLTIEQLKAAKLPLIIFGAGPVGELLLHACRSFNLEVAGFCDNNIHKKGRVINGLPVMYAPELLDQFPDAVFLIGVADIQDIVEQLSRMGYTRWTDCSILKHFNINNLPLSISPDAAEFVLSACLLCHENYLTPEKLFIRSVDVIITERCSMHCRDCSNLMQYYKHPRDCDVEQVISSIDVLCRYLDEMNEFRIIGGEPFMHPQLHLITRHLVAEPQVKRVVINTNATLLPRPDQLSDLKYKKVLLMITDYGELSRNLSKLIALAEENGIPYYVIKAQGWTDCSKIMRHDRTPEEQQKVFSQCCAKNLITLSHGRLFRCPFIANSLRLHAVPERGSDFLDLHLAATNGVAVYEMKKILRDFLSDTKYFEGCDYCNGRFYDDPEIPPAIQIKQPLEYHRYK